MDLFGLKLTGYRRFKNAEINLSGKLIALIGPNEAGKTSLLEALKRTNESSALAQTDITRGETKSQEEIILEARYLLDELERQNLRENLGINDSKWLFVEKKRDGRINYRLDPQTEIPNLNSVISTVPEILQFSEGDRSIPSMTNLEPYTVTQGIQNLADLANLDLRNLRNLILTGDQQETWTKIAAANKKLEQEFSWSQNKALQVSFRVENTYLRIYINSHDEIFHYLDLRSEGFKQYVALLAFLQTRRSDQPKILLIDEAETHLHYQAQADLIQMLTHQNLVKKVIYTTHSLGCLPEDLGTAIRMIKQQGDHSVIQNWFWSEEPQSGLSPLLYGIGAGTLAFMALRNAIITEGPTDFLLLPTMLRDAIGKEYLDFQVVPGLSAASKTDVGIFEKGAPRVSYLTDNDKGGRDLCNWLIDKVGIPQDRVLSLPQINGQDTVLEDYLDPVVYLKAMNITLKEWQKIEFPSTELPENNRPQKIEEWCELQGKKPPDKRVVAQHILENNYSSSILDQKYCTVFANLYGEIKNAISLSTSS